MTSTLSSEELKAQEERVKSAKAQYLDRKNKYKNIAVKISEELLKGIDLREDAYVKLITGQIGVVTIRPLAEGEIMEVFGYVGLTNIENIGSGGFKTEDYDFFWTLVSVSTGLPKELIKTTFAMGESATLATRILELSGFSGTPEEEIEDF